MTRWMSVWSVVAALSITVCGGDAQERGEAAVRSSDADLAALAEALLPDLAARSGLELHAPVRVERRTREELVRYLRSKLDEELPAEEARRKVRAYAFLGMVPDSLDLRDVLLDVYTEQVAGFYDPDSTALFVLDDQPAQALQGLLVHELVHAVQDQNANLDSLTNPERGNDEATAAQAAIEGHATLVMLEFLTEKARGVRVDLAQMPDFASRLRPVLQGMDRQYPRLAGAPRVVRESLLLPYVEGAAYVQDLWVKENRAAPFGPFLPRSTEQVLTHDRVDRPVLFALDVPGVEILDQDDLGRLELGIFLEEHLGSGTAALATGWGGDHYALIRDADGAEGLVLAVVWDDAEARDAFAEALAPAVREFPVGGELRVEDGEWGPAVWIHVGSAVGRAASMRSRILR
ncbi:MAG: DUF6782 family putative metallopeptidase [Gemmatimonadota bacterium]